MFKTVLILTLIVAGFTGKSISDDSGIIILKINKNPEKVENIAALSKELQNKRIIYIGEVHNNPLHHSVQLELIRNLYQNSYKIAIGMEMFQDDFQDVLDRYIAGWMDEKEFLEKTEYQKRWGYDYSLYKPILDFARENRIPVAALSINSDTVKKISNSGITGADSLELSKLPVGIDFTDEDYEEFLKKLYDSHPKSEKSDFNKFKSIQLIWDEAMAENLDAFLKTHKDYTMVVIAGNGHIAYSYGIPQRAYRRNGLSYATVLNDTEHKTGVSDYVVYSNGIGH